jgi:hypothetical protein
MIAITYSPNQLDLYVLKKITQINYLKTTLNQYLFTNLFF